MLLLLGGDIVRNPGPEIIPELRSLSLNIFSLRSFQKRTKLVGMRGDLGYPEIVSIQETKLDPSFRTGELGLSNYSVYRKYRNSNGGGVLVAVHESVKSQCFGGVGTDLEAV